MNETSLDDSDIDENYNPSKSAIVCGSILQPASSELISTF